MDTTDQSRAAMNADAMQEIREAMEALGFEETTVFAEAEEAADAAIGVPLTQIENTIKAAIAAAGLAHADPTFALKCALVSLAPARIAQLYVTHATKAALDHAHMPHPTDADGRMYMALAVQAVCIAFSNHVQEFHIDPVSGDARQMPDDDETQAMLDSAYGEVLALIVGDPPVARSAADAADDGTENSEPEDSNNPPSDGAEPQETPEKVPLIADEPFPDLDVALHHDAALPEHARH